MTFYEQRSTERAVSDRVMAKVLSRSFLTAHLLTGDATQAEKAVMEALDVWDPDTEDQEYLFQLTLRTAVERQNTVSLPLSNEE